MRSRFRLDHRHDRLEDRGKLHGPELELLGPDELEKALHHLVQPPHLRADDRDVFEQRRSIVRLLVGEQLLEQLEPNHRRMQRVLDLVRQPGRQPAERRHPARIAQRRLDVPQMFEVPGHHHDGELPAANAVDDVGADELLARARRSRPPLGRARPSSGTRITSGPCDRRSARLSSTSRR